MKLKIEKLEEELELGSDEFRELEKLRMELGQLGGAGHYFGNDEGTDYCGGERDAMEQEELKKVLRLLAAGEKKINLKERSFEFF